MFKRIKAWLIQKYLPDWALLEYRETLAATQKSAATLREENRLLRAYIDGLEKALRYDRSIKIDVRGGTAHERDSKSII